MRGKRNKTVTVSEAMEIAGWSRWTVYKTIRCNHVKAYKESTGWKIDRQSLIDLLSGEVYYFE